MLSRLSLRDFVIVEQLEVELGPGFTVLTGETGAGKSILIDALQLALGSRGDTGQVREGSTRLDISAEFDLASQRGVHDWLAEAGFDAEPGPGLLVRRTLDQGGKSRAWINGSAATLAQLRELGDRLVDIHGQHAWQSLTRPATVRELLDAYAGLDLSGLQAAWALWREAAARLDAARTRGADLERERERLQWQIGELAKLAPAAGEWEELDAEHRRLGHAQAIQEAVQRAIECLDEGSDNARGLTDQAEAALQAVAAHAPELNEVMAVLQSAQAQLADATHSLQTALRRSELDPQRLAELDARLSAWLGLARRYRRMPQDLPALLQGWQQELQSVEAATDLDQLTQQEQAAQARYRQLAGQASAARQQAAPRLAQAVTTAMQQLGMAGGRFEVGLMPSPEPLAAGLEQVEFRVAGHAGSTPRPLGKVASGGELSRIALAIAVTTSQLGQAGTLIFDEVDAGVGGAVAESVGQLMKRLGRDRQVLAVTHLPQVAACADTHHVVSKAVVGKNARSAVQAVSGEARVAEIARMLGGQQLSGAGLAHAKEMLAAAHQPAAAKTARNRR